VCRRAIICAPDNGFVIFVELAKAVEFRRTAECDRECSRINGLAPDSEHRRLLGVELTARGVKGLLRPDVWIAEQLRLPACARGKRPSAGLAAAYDQNARAFDFGLLIVVSEANQRVQSRVHRTNRQIDESFRAELGD
jgi:hypothetical protein